MLTVHIVPRNSKPHFAPTYDVCAAGYSSVYNFPTRKAAKDFCNAMGFEIFGDKSKTSPKKCECTIYNPHYTSTKIRREFGERSFKYVTRAA